VHGKCPTDGVVAATVRGIAFGAAGAAAGAAWNLMAGLKAEQTFVNTLASLRTLSGSNAVYSGFAPSSWAIGGTVGGNVASNVIGNANQ
jgi:hypothetical protein